MRLEGRIDAVHEGVTLRAVQPGRKVLHDARVGVHPGERLAIGIAETAEQQAPGRQGGRHGRQVCRSPWSRATLGQLAALDLRVRR